MQSSGEEKKYMYAVNIGYYLRTITMYFSEGNQLLLYSVQCKLLFYAFQLKFVSTIQQLKCYSMMKCVCNTDQMQLASHSKLDKFNLIFDPQNLKATNIIHVPAT